MAGAKKSGKKAKGKDRRGDPPAPSGCAVPSGFAFLPPGVNPGDQIVFGGFNPTTGEPIWNVVPYPENPSGQVWTAGANGPFWANQ